MTTDRGVGLRVEDLPFSLRPELLAEILNKPLRQTYALLEAGKIPGAQKAGAHWRINRDVVIDWLRGNSAPR